MRKTMNKLLLLASLALGAFSCQTFYNSTLAGHAAMEMPLPQLQEGRSTALDLVLQGTRAGSVWTGDSTSSLQAGLAGTQAFGTPGLHLDLSLAGCVFSALNDVRPLAKSVLSDQPSVLVASSGYTVQAQAGVSTERPGFQLFVGLSAVASQDFGGYPDWRRQVASSPSSHAVDESPSGRILEYWGILEARFIQSPGLNLRTMAGLGQGFSNWEDVLAAPVGKRYSAYKAGVGFDNGPVTLWFKWEQFSLLNSGPSVSVNFHLM